VEVIRHDHVGVQSNAESLAHFSHQFQKVLAAPRIREDDLSVGATVRYVIPSMSDINP
jgi:hypothetical protein